MSIEVGGGNEELGTLAPMRVLAGDIGGTKTRLGVFEVEGSDCRMVEECSYPSRDYPGLGKIVADFLGSGGMDCRAACFGIAGPVTGRRMHTTNLPWVVDADELEGASGIPAVVLLNDLEATGWGGGALNESQFEVLNPGRSDAVGNGASRIVPVDLFIPGCPPHPLTLLDGLLRFLGRT